MGRAADNNAIVPRIGSRTIKRMVEGSPDFNRQSLLQEIFAQWGGPASFAGDLVGEFRIAKPGSVVRQRLMDGVLRMVNWQSQSQVNAPVDQMTEEELIQSIQNISHKIEGKSAG